MDSPAAGILESCTSEIPWSAAVFSSRESTDVLLATVRALRKCGGASLRVDVLINGQRGLADDFLVAARREPLGLADVRVWFTPYADKAHAWNEYVHRIWDGRSWASAFLWGIDPSSFCHRCKGYVIR